MPMYNTPNQYNGDGYDGPSRDRQEIYNEGYPQEQMFGNSSDDFEKIHNHEKIHEKSTVFQLPSQFNFQLKAIYWSICILTGVLGFGFIVASVLLTSMGLWSLVRFCTIFGSLLIFISVILVAIPAAIKMFTDS